MSRFLQLPRELRDLIYEHYFRGEGGFVHDFAANRLRRADGYPIELALVLACRQIAVESHGLALQINTLGFMTFHSDDTQEHASLLHILNRNIFTEKTCLLNSIAPKLLSWEQAPNSSLKSEYELHDEKKALELKKASPRPWQITHLEALAELRELMTDAGSSRGNTKYTCSAASAALRLLQSMPKAARDNIRKVLLIEDRESIAFPESHGRGFIDVCRDHPQLKVERFVSLWRNGLPMSYKDLPIHLNGYQSFLDDGLQRFDGCDANIISKEVGTWIIEAWALPSLGMPHGSFTLVLDGDPLPERSSQVFKIIQRDAAWQTALDICYARGVLPRPSWFRQRPRTNGFIHEDFPEAVGAISMHSSLIRTNFPVCAPYDVEQLLREHEGWTPKD